MTTSRPLSLPLCLSLSSSLSLSLSLISGNQRTADGCRARYMLLDDQRMRLHNNATWSKEEHRRLAEMAASGKLKAATGAERGKAQRKVAKQQVFIANANVEAESETTRPLPAPPLSPWSNAAMAVGTRSPLQCLNHFYGSMLHKQLKLRRSESV